MLREVYGAAMKKSVHAIFFAVIFVLIAGTQGSLPQEEDLQANLPIDLDLPSQEIYRDAFQNSLPAVVWNEWSLEPFLQALALNKPVLLNISVAWDANCYRMDADVFSDPSVAFIVNNFCIPIRIDGDERPDIRQAYGARVWPSLFFLLPDGRPLIWQKEGKGENPIALGYVNADAMKSLTLETFKYFRSSMKKAIELAQSHMKKETAASRLKPITLTAEIGEKIASSLKANFDLQHGGFGIGPKFLVPFASDFALHMYSLNSNQVMFEIASRTSEAIMRSEMNDTVDGGIFRISNTADWTKPSHEKLLNRNAFLLSNLADLYAMSGREEYREDAESILSYLLDTLESPDGGFYAGQYADFGYSDGYYSAPQEDRKVAVAPIVDKRFFCDQNCIVVSALLKASSYFDDQMLFEKARKAAEFILDRLYFPGRGAFHSFYEGRAQLIGMLEDNAFLCRMLIDLYQHTGEDRWLAEAERVADFIIDNLKDVTRGGYYDFIRNDGAPGKLKIVQKSIDSNALMARNMIRLYYLTGKERYVREAYRTLELFSGVYPQYGVSAALYGLACSEYFEQPTRIIIIGKLHDPKAMSLMRAGNRIADPWKLIKFIDEESDEAKAINMAQAATPALFFVRESVISPAVQKKDGLQEQFENFKRSLLQVK